jgi:hypothetical protein
MALRRSKEQPRIDGRSGEHLGSPSARYSQPKRRPQSDPKTWKRMKSKAVAACPMRRQARLAREKTQEPRLAVSDRPDHQNLECPVGPLEKTEQLQGAPPAERQVG